MIKKNHVLSVFGLLLLFQCNPINKNYTKEFEKFVFDSDQILFDSDILHPAYAYLKNGKLKGLEFNNHPECGDYIKRYFFSENTKIKKIIIEKNYYNENCGKTFDSLFIIDPILNKTIIYTDDTNGKEIESNVLQEEKINIDHYMKMIKNWKNK